MDNNRQSLVQVWTNRIRDAQQHKKEKFGQDAERCWRYYGESTHAFMWTERDEALGPDLPKPIYRATVAKSAEYVAVVAPYVFHRVPARTVIPRRPTLPPELLGLLASMQNPAIQPGMIQPGTPVPLSQQQLVDRLRAMLMEWWLNFTPGEFDLRGESQRSLVEGMVKGRGLLWHEFFDSGHGTMFGSFFDTVDHLVIDPDATVLRSATWIARKRRRPVWQVAREFAYPEQKLRKFAKTATHRPNDDLDEGSAVTVRPDSPQEIIEYWEVYSACGMGHRFRGVEDREPEAYQALEELGDYIYLAIVPGLDEPLNLHEGVLGSSDARTEIKRRLAWPVQWYADRAHPWPFTELDFRFRNNCVWPLSNLAPALPLQMFLNLAYSFVMGRIQTTCCDTIIASQGLDKALQEAIRNPVDRDVVAVKDSLAGAAADVAKMVHVLQHPPLNRDLYAAISMVEDAFDKATGLVDLMYGMHGARQMRSSAEAQIKQQNMISRPDAMADQFEDFMSRVAQKEAFATRLHVEAPVSLFGEENYMNSPVGGGPLTMAWNMFVNTPDPYRAALDLSYSVEAHSGRKPNKQRQVENVTQAMPIVMQPFLSYYQTTGDPRPFNAMLRRWGEAADMDTGEMMLPPLMPQMAPGQGAPPPNPQQPQTQQQQNMA